MTWTGVFGAVTMVLVGMVGDFYSQTEAVRSVDANTMFLLSGMMTLVVLSCISCVSMMLFFDYYRD